MDNTQLPLSFDLEQLWGSRLGFETDRDIPTTHSLTTPVVRIPFPLLTPPSAKPYTSDSHDTLQSRLTQSTSSRSQDHIQLNSLSLRRHIPPKLVPCNFSPRKWFASPILDRGQTTMNTASSTGQDPFSINSTHSRTPSLELPQSSMQGDGPLYSPLVAHGGLYLSQSGQNFYPSGLSLLQSPTHPPPYLSHSTINDDDDDFSGHSLQSPIKLSSTQFSATYMPSGVASSSDSTTDYPTSTSSYPTTDHLTIDEETDLSFTTMAPESRVDVFSTTSTPIRITLRAKLRSCSTREFHPSPPTEADSITDAETRPYVAIFRRNHHAVEFDLSVSHCPAILCDEHARMHTIRSFEVRLEAVSRKFDGRRWREAPVAFARLSEGKTPTRSADAIQPLLVGRNEAVGSTYKGAWDRLQFEKATGGNGKKMSTQAYYVYRVRVSANTAGGATLCVAVAESRRLVVYGRNPGSIRVPGEEREVCAKRRRGPRRKDGSGA
jgi:hypothetical protein